MYVRISGTRRQGGARVLFGDADLDYDPLGSSSHRELTGALLEASWPAWYVRSYHLHPSHLAGEDSIKEFFALLHLLAGQVLDDKPSLPLD